MPYSEISFIHSRKTAKRNSFPAFLPRQLSHFLKRAPPGERAGWDEVYLTRHNLLLKRQKSKAVSILRSANLQVLLYCRLTAVLPPQRTCVYFLILRYERENCHLHAQG